MILVVWRGEPFPENCFFAFHFQDRHIHDAEKKANDLRIELKDVQWKMNKLLEGFSAGGDND